jgi:hypothetical protein
MAVVETMDPRTRLLVPHCDPAEGVGAFALVRERRAARQVDQPGRPTVQ